MEAEEIGQVEIGQIGGRALVILTAADPGSIPRTTDGLWNIIRSDLGAQPRVSPECFWVHAPRFYSTPLPKKNFGF